MTTMGTARYTQHQVYCVMKSSASITTCETLTGHHVVHRQDGSPVAAQHSKIHRAFLVSCITGWRRSNCGDVSLDSPLTRDTTPSKRGGPRLRRDRASCFKQ